MATPRPAPSEQILLLAGGGHAHVAVLADWIRRGPPPGVRTLLLTPERYLTYSGMMPGWLAGQHDKDEGLVDLAALAERAGVIWVEGRLVALDPDARAAQTDSGEMSPRSIPEAWGGHARCWAMIRASSTFARSRALPGGSRPSTRQRVSWSRAAGQGAWSWLSACAISRALNRALR